MDNYQLTFKLCSIMLRYPDKEWVDNEEIQELILSIENEEVRSSILSFWNYTREMSWEELAENYVRWFDLTENTTLYLTYGIFGDNRERGPAFVKLKLEFAKAGFYIKENELPDYLPLILDFASIAELKCVTKVLAIHLKAIKALNKELHKQMNPYAYLVKAALIIIESLLPRKEERIDHHAG
ncbi:nitrate reductase molybdenum cofactor assembly chaperone [Bacillus tuaregi]|uniref:nitrate reductase molybdenum cofactor assembly chaperone n=1 Tax=Bacillus tuaregi TaxID=1816695 RepID=UPI0008F8C0C1|nr:nitrate reductase molybdenum cofactor assembly chaperone [Bacillus tuaregi]